MDPALGPAVGLLHCQQLLANLVQFLDAPARVAQDGAVLRALARAVEHGCGLRAARPAGAVAGVGAGRDGNAIVGALAGDAVAQDRAGVLPQAEHGAQVAPEAGRQQQQGGFEILDERVHASRSPSPYLGKPAGNCQVLPEKNFREL